MEKEIQKVVLLPDIKYAKTQMLYNALWFSLLLVCFVVLLMILSFPQFFLVQLPRYYKLLFHEGSAGNIFFVRVGWSLGSMFVIAAVSRYIALYATLMKKEVAVTMDEGGVQSRYGMFAQKIPWDSYREVRVTDFPLRMKFAPKKILLAHSTFSGDALRKKIVAYKKSIQK